MRTFGTPSLAILTLDTQTSAWFHNDDEVVETCTIVALGGALLEAHLHLRIHSLALWPVVASLLLIITIPPSEGETVRSLFALPNGVIP